MAPNIAAECPMSLIFSGSGPIRRLMSLRGPKWILSSIAAALLLTTALFYLSVDGARGHEQEQALMWARQVASQAQGIVFAARQQGSEDPIEEAVSFLSQGSEPRPMQIVRWLTDVGAALEVIRFDFDKNTLTYERVLSPEKGEGVRIQIPFSYHGFLGASRPFTSDILVVLTFLLIGSGFCFGIPALFDRRSKEEEISPEELERRRKISAIRDWIGEAKDLLTQLGLHIREVIRQANILAQASVNSRNAVRDLRGRIHEEIDHLRAEQSRIAKDELSLKDLETGILNMILEYRKAQDVPYELLQKLEDVYRNLRTYRGSTEAKSDVLKRLEKRLEPWAADADIAFHSFDGVFEATSAMEGHIRMTTENILQQAKSYQEHQKKLQSAPALSPAVQNASGPEDLEEWLPLKFRRKKMISGSGR